MATVPTRASMRCLEKDKGMPDYLKPLFNRRLLADALRELPPYPDDAQRAIASSWAAGAANGGLLGRKENPCKASFSAR
jgi:hypothetical protein